MRVTRGLAICRRKARGVPNGDREDSLGLSNAMPQGTGPPDRGALKGRESLAILHDFHKCPDLSG